MWNIALKYNKLFYFFYSKIVEIKKTKYFFLIKYLLLFYTLIKLKYTIFI